MWELVAILTIGAILLKNGAPGAPSAEPSVPFPGTEFSYPMPLPGGKNMIAIPNMPVSPAWDDLPQALHVYAEDFPVVVGDEGSLVLIIQRLLYHRGFLVPQDGILDAVTRAAALTGGYASENFASGVLTTEIQASDLKLLATEHQALLSGVVVHPYKPAP